MKKALLVLIALLAVVGMTFAEEAKSLEERVAALEGKVDHHAVAVTFKGEAAVVFGMDLDTNGTGFNANTGVGKFEFFLIDEVTKESAGDGMWGHIVVEKMFVKVTEGGLSTQVKNVTARVNLSEMLYVKIYGVPNVKVDKAAAITAANNVSKDFTDNGGVIFGITSGPIDHFEVLVTSQADISSNTSNAYSIGIMTKVVPADIFALEAAFGMSTVSTDGMAVGLKPIITLSDVMNGVEVYGGFDMVLPSSGNSSYDIAAGATLNFSEANGDDKKSNLTASFHMNNSSKTDAKVVFTELDGDDGAVASLGTVVTLALTDLTGTVMGMDFDAKISYATGGLKPFAEFGFDNKATTVATDDVMNLKAGVELGADFTSINNTTLTLAYESSDLSSSAKKNGKVTFTTKVAF